MKYIGGALMICLSSNILAGCQQYPGSLVCRDIKLPEIKQQGYVSLHNVDVKSTTEVDGMFSGEKSHFYGKIFVKGSAKINQSTLDQETIVQGSLVSDRSQFEDVVITANEATFSSSNLKNILFKITSKAQQKVFLRGSTVVQGHIKFESGHGQVFLDPQSRIVGEVIGGEIVK